MQQLLAPIDPTYCPVKRQYIWAIFYNISKNYLEPLNFPKLPPIDRFCTEKYFTSSLHNAIKMFQGVPNLACRILVKFSCTLLICINILFKDLQHNCPWKIMLEGSQSLTFDLWT